jgi:predicted metal-dependent peptidase
MSAALSQALAVQRLTRARVQLLLRQPFFGTITMRMPFVDVATSPALAFITTMATDGKRMFYHAPFVESLDNQELMAVLAHEVMHVVLLHMTRRNGRDGKLWNVAGDHAINLILTDAHSFADGQTERFKLPKDHLADKKYIGWSSERIYDDLRQQQPPNNGGGSGYGDPGGCGGVIDGPSSGSALTKQEIAQIESEAAVIVAQAAQAAKSRGKLPGNLAGLIEQFYKPRIDWRAELRKFIAQVVNSDYTWSRPNRRFAHAGLILPGPLKEGVGEIVIAVDTSGSVSDAELSQFGGEMRDIIDEVKPSETTVIYCDAAVARVDTFHHGDNFGVMRVAGRGGTSFDPPFEWVRESGKQPKAFIYLTDGGAPSPSVEPPFPVLWITTQANSFSFGKVIKLEVGE